MAEYQSRYRGDSKSGYKALNCTLPNALIFQTFSFLGQTPPLSARIARKALIFQGFTFVCNIYPLSYPHRERLSEGMASRTGGARKGERAPRQAVRET